MPQWLELAWDTPQPIAQVQLTFEGQLLREYHACPPFYRDPQTVADYEIQAWREGTWVSLVKARRNTATRVVHPLPSELLTDRLRLMVQATNGDRSAGLFEIRCYAADTCTPTPFGPKTRKV